ncbi:ABC transporter permease [Streptomyces tubercidicus]|uniref:ABC transporter permease n=1 Tax=Streptomyces tubercidicus TaxID=47759 RepID=UPI0036C25EC1
MYLHPAQVVRHSAANAFADMRAIYTWKTWTFGWLGRMLAQVTFFALLGRATGGPGQVTYLVIGNSLMTCVIESLTVVASSTWERQSGTLALLAAAPVKPVWVFCGRSLQWPLSGTGTSLVALLGLAPLFGVSWHIEQIPLVAALVVITAVTTYFLGLGLSAFVLNAGGLRNVVTNAGYLLMMAICGVQVPVGFWPQWVGWIAQTIPLTHCLAALRSVVAGAPLTVVGAHTAMGVLIGLLWLGVAYLAFDALLRRGRRAGTIDFTD